MNNRAGSARKVLESHFWHRHSQVILIYVFAALAVVVASFLDKAFLSVRNFNNLLLAVVPLALAGFAQTIIIVSGGIDLSVGAMVSLANVVCVACMRAKEPNGYVLAVAAGLGAAIACGAFNGLVVAKGRIQPVIATIATMSMFAGMALYISPIPGGKVHREFSRFLIGRSGFPAPLILLAAVLLLLFLLTNRTRFGIHLRSVGGNEKAAYFTGIAVGRVKVAAYALSGLLAGMAGVFLAAQMSTGDATVGNLFTMNSIAISVIGGTLLTGAVGEVTGTVVGAFILIVINNILNLVGVSSFYQYVFQGIILIAALAISSLRSKA